MQVIFPDPKKNYFVNATIVAEGGGKGWAIHPFPYSSHAPCDWNPGAFGQHCKWGCKRCGAPWYAADGACPDNNCKHAADLPQNITYGKAIPDLVMLHERGAPLFERFVRREISFKRSHDLTIAYPRTRQPSSARRCTGPTLSRTAWWCRPTSPLATTCCAGDGTARRRKTAGRGSECASE